jgi:rubredoxin
VSVSEWLFGEAGMSAWDWIKLIGVAVFIIIGVIVGVFWLLRRVRCPKCKKLFQMKASEPKRTQYGSGLDGYDEVLTRWTCQACGHAWESKQEISHHPDHRPNRPGD